MGLSVLGGPRGLTFLRTPHRYALTGQGKLDEAVPMCNRVLWIFEKTYGPEQLKFMTLARTSFQAWLLLTLCRISRVTTRIIRTNERGLTVMPAT